MIDLHIHTNYSDGSDNVIEILKKAEELKLEYISITDHDTCKAYNELEKINISDYYSGKLISGIEIKCSYLGRTVEVLGYNINTYKMQNWIDEFYKDKQRDMLQKKYFNILYNKCIKMGLHLTQKEEIIWNPNNDWASFTIYSDFKKYKENEEKLLKDIWEDFSIFNRKYCANPNYELFIDKSGDYPSLEQTLEAIKNAQGKSFLAHLFVYKWIENKPEFMEALVGNFKIDGAECFHSDFSEDNIKYLLDFCDKNNLLKSGGTDYHGKNKPTINLAKGHGDLQINSNLIEEWI